MSRSEVISFQTETGEVFIRQFNAGELALTGLKDASIVLGVHANTVRRWVDSEFLEALILPSGVRRIKLSSLEQVYKSMYGSPLRASDKDSPTIPEVS